MLPDIGGEIGAKLAIAIGAVAIALLLFFLLMRTWRQRGTRAFLRGGKNRRPRLAVLDAAAVDPRRRLVLVRRDDVEHLILIGGPSDVVVESGINAADSDTSLAKPSGETAEVAAPTARLQDTGPLSAGLTVAAEQQPEEQPVDAAPVAGSPSPAEATPEPEERVEAAAPSEERAPAPAAREARPDIANILDSNRQRVFGNSDAVQSSPYVQAYMDAEESPAIGPAPDSGIAPAGSSARTEPVPAAPSVLRFEDFLDTEVAGDLSSTRPDRASPPVRTAVSATQTPAAAEPVVPESEKALDEEMSRLLQQLSRKR